MKGNGAPVARSLQREQVNDLVEATTFVLGEQRILNVRRGRLMKMLGGLEEADRIELERANHRVQLAKEQLYEACSDLERLEEIAAQKKEVYGELVAVDAEDEHILVDGEREISVRGAAAGSQIVRPELLREGAKGLIARRRQLRQDGEISKEEASAI